MELANFSLVTDNFLGIYHCIAVKGAKSGPVS